MTEQISALADNEIDFESAEHLLSTMQHHGYFSDAWSQYHLIGDVMRGAEPLSQNFKHNLMAKIDLEPTVLSPNAVLPYQHKKPLIQEKAKQPIIWSIAASFTAVMAVSFALLQTQVSTPSGFTVASTSAPVAEPIKQLPAALVASSEETVPEGYLMAHHASAPSTTSYYIQSASYSE